MNNCTSYDANRHSLYKAFTFLPNVYIIHTYYKLNLQPKREVSTSGVKVPALLTGGFDVTDPSS